MIRSIAGKILRKIGRVSPRAHDRFWDFYFLRRHRRTGDAFRWQRIQPCLESKVESAAAVVGNELFVFAGYRTLDLPSQLVEIYDLANERWKSPIAFQDGLPHTHQGMASDGTRFVYLAGGQVGPNASPCVADVSVFDARERTWHALPGLPAARYAPVVRILRGRLHVVAGAEPDRFTHASDHWSLAISDGRATETNWRSEPPIPHGGHHRASGVIGDRLYVFGGQERDVRPIPGTPRFECDWETPMEIMFGDAFSYSPEKRAWETLTPMPAGASHTEFTTVTHGKYAVVLGGLVQRNTLTSAIQVYDSETNRWKIAGHLPYVLKGHVAGLYGETLFVFAGQRGTGATSLKPGAVLRSGWKTKLPDLDALFASG